MGKVLNANLLSKITGSEIRHKKVFLKICSFYILLHACTEESSFSSSASVLVTSLQFCNTAVFRCTTVT